MWINKSSLESMGNKNELGSRKTETILTNFQKVLYLEKDELLVPQ